MKALFSIFFCVSTFAFGQDDCEATIEKGTHLGLNQQVSIDAAWEEAVDNCYPGKAERLLANCEPISDEESTQYRCTQEVSCTTCGGNLVRKYEALD